MYKKSWPSSFKIKQHTYTYFNKNNMTETSYKNVSTSHIYMLYVHEFSKRVLIFCKLVNLYQPIIFVLL